MGAAMQAAGLDPEGSLTSQWKTKDVFAFVELHIEQGPLLEQGDSRIGVVSSIAGIQRFTARFEGQADHAGTTPMPTRRDACCAAAEAVLAIERVGRTAGQVTTTGDIKIEPGFSNVVPSGAQLRAEMRAPDEMQLGQMQDEIENELLRIASARRVAHKTDWMDSEESTPMTPLVKSAIEDAAEDLGYPRTELYSGAGHDAAQMARLGPAGMLFVPSKSGRSHCPEEDTAIEDLAAGVHVLTQTLSRLDQL
jgi:N-carbamoyl-L-amino-acid hydrolase